MRDWRREDFSQFIENSQLGMVYFYTPLCGTCQLAGKMLQVVESMLEVESGKMNLNYFANLAEDFRIESVPCLLIFKDGEVAETIYAFHSVPYLLEKLKTVFG
ncbi:thioredoxin family protein [Bacillus rubiinfantis]|uniref:thioredoxin family protein n=1 Tax=Bacillus rubiinfantis TaxID=1499680 RepID=UPI0005A73EF5|nr:thioredoxin family protein [Bacillus rubiinfantis]